MSRPVTPLDLLLQRYGLEPSDGFRPMDTGLLNRSYEVVSGGHRYFLKHYLPYAASGHGVPPIDGYGRPRSAPYTILFQHRAAAALAEGGFPAVAPLADLDGRTLVPARGRLFALFPWCPGVHRRGADLTPGEAAGLGGLLAAIHTGLAAALPRVPQPLFLPTKSAAHTLAEIDQLLEIIERRPHPDAMDELAWFRLTERREMLPGLATRRPGPHVLGEVGYIHGDFHMGNLMWESPDRGSAVTGVLDWDKTAVGCYGDELVSAALVFFADQATGLLDLAAVRAFAAGYAAARPAMTATEAAASVHRVWWERLTDLWILVWRYQREDPRPDSLFPGTAALVPWWTDNYERVLEAFLAGVSGPAGVDAKVPVPIPAPARPQPAESFAEPLTGTAPRC